MKNITLIMLVFVLATLISSCGIPKEEFNKTQKELADSQAAFELKEKELAECNSQLKVCKDNASEAQKALQTLGSEYSTMEEKHANLDADYNAMVKLLEKIKNANALRQKAMNELLSKFEALIKSGKLSIGVNDGRMVIQLPSEVLFKVGRSNLSKDGKAAIAEVAEVLKTIEGRKFQVAGHTDNQRASSRVNPNWTLSYKRARSVFDLLVKNEMDESMLSLAAYAEYSPVATNDTKEGRKLNRRIEIVLLPTSDELPLKQLMKIEKVEQNIDTTVEKAK